MQARIRNSLQTEFAGGNTGNSSWVLDVAGAGDLDELMQWFTDAAAVRSWGGPNFRYPYSRDSFREDCRWPAMASRCLRDAAGRLCGFGQYYERDGRINLARLAVHPGRRGQGLGRRLVTMLMDAAIAELALDEFSLYVYRDNAAAVACYQSLGFRIRDYPADRELADECWFMTRPAPAGRQKRQTEKEKST